MIFVQWVFFIAAHCTGIFITHNRAQSATKRCEKEKKSYRLSMYLNHNLDIASKKNA